MGAILLYDTICKMSTGRKPPCGHLAVEKEKYKKKESFPLMKNPLNEKKPNGLALIPFVIFIAIYMDAGVYYQVKGKEMAILPVSLRYRHVSGGAGGLYHVQGHHQRKV